MMHCKYNSSGYASKRPLGAHEVGVWVGGYFDPILVLKRKKICKGVGVPALKIVINLSRTYKKLHCQGEPYLSNTYNNPVTFFIVSDHLNDLDRYIS